MGTHVRDETGVLVIAIGGMTYYNAQDPIKTWGISYSGYDSTKYSKIKEAFESGAIVGNMIFVGEDKTYSFDEYIKELDKRSKNNV